MTKVFDTLLDPYHGPQMLRTQLQIRLPEPHKGYKSNFPQEWENRRSSHQKCSIRKGVLRNFAKFTEKHLSCQSLLFNKVAGLRPATLLKKRPWQRCFHVNFVKFLRIPLEDCFQQSSNF